MPFDFQGVAKRRPMRSDVPSSNPPATPLVCITAMAKISSRQFVNPPQNQHWRGSVAIFPVGDRADQRAARVSREIR